MFSKSSGIEPTKLTMIGTSLLDWIILAKLGAPGFDRPTALIQPPPLTLNIVGFG